MATQTTTFDPKDLPSKRALKAEKKRERVAEAVKQKARANELKQVVKQASQNYRLKKRENRKHIKEINVKAIEERRAELKRAQYSTNVKLAMEEFHKQQQADNLRRKLLIRQIGIETKIEYVKTLRQIDEAYSELRHKQASFKVKKWFFGVGKEFSRIRWINRQKLLKDFIIIVIIVVIMSLIFLGIDLLVLKWI